MGVEVVGSGCGHEGRRPSYHKVAIPGVGRIVWLAQGVDVIGLIYAIPAELDGEALLVGEIVHRERIIDVVYPEKSGRRGRAAWQHID